jgi:hypothetical protein
MVEHANIRLQRGDNSSTCIYQIDLEIKDTIDTYKCVPYLDVHLEIEREDWLRKTLYNKIDDFIFSNFPFICRGKS